MRNAFWKGGLFSILVGLLNSFPAWADGVDGPVDGGIGLQRPVTPIAEAIKSFNDLWLVPIMVGITLFVFILMIVIMVRFREKANPVPSKTTHNSALEVVWTLVPVIILLVMAIPSMKILYAQDRIPEAELVVKVAGNTWNWEYSYPDHENIDPYISNIVDVALDEKRDSNNKALTHDQIRQIIESRPQDEPRLNGRPYLFATDAPLIVPVDTIVEVQVTSMNNIHAFAVPQFGVKIDAIPGIINHTWFKVNEGEEGTYYGQCSEICGVNHSFMPIEVKVVSKQEFARWVANNGSFDIQYSQNTLGGQSTAGMQ